MWRVDLQPAVVKLGGNKSVAIGDSKGLLELLASIVFDKTITTEKDQREKQFSETNTILQEWQLVGFYYFLQYFVSEKVYSGKKKTLNYLHKENTAGESKIEYKYYSSLRMQNHPLIW